MNNNFINKMNRSISTTLKRWYDNYTWFSMVAMNGDEGHNRYLYNKRQREKDKKYTAKTISTVSI